MTAMPNAALFRSESKDSGFHANEPLKRILGFYLKAYSFPISEHPGPSPPVVINDTSLHLTKIAKSKYFSDIQNESYSPLNSLYSDM